MLGTVLTLFFINVICYICSGKFAEHNIMRREPVVILENSSAILFKEKLYCPILFFLR